jgi:hypothetical protein
MELTDTHLTLMAPIVEVVGTNRTITMRGSSGATHQMEAAVGQNGSNGEPGHMSGDIYIMALDVTNSKSLHIVSLGGDGADGQAGGNGKDGQRSEAPKVQYLQGSRNSIENAVLHEGYKAEWGWRNQRSSDGDWFYTVLYNSRTDFETVKLSVINGKGSKEPTNGGNGGSGGAKAPPGVQHFFLKNSNTLIAVTNLSGRCGKVGKGGLAGATVPVCSQVDYLCNGKSSWSNLLGVIYISKYDVKYECGEPKTLDCIKMFPAASDSKDGAPGHTIGALVLEHPMDFSPVEDLQVFIEASEKENRSELNEFLEFLATLID